ncbi:putative alpha/beta hydrolase [Mycobacterium parmense]|uniref:Uncharacterized protein n=1 Tax=Mycobacterium parmense TaxID=185642 RepID=A0A7I7YXF4_9MYCO|nr:alpha/beta hydrolase [Mycobacterium parmense]MCV7349878.1 hypothetical protein [Mycobacterium parmense]ORW59998.1 hypothetical protein AWC20_09440 [Mycobacterium parmense]BBZ46595.1 hypothetical protein MPRM_38760 [Mycobacterium parmense]
MQLRYLSVAMLVVEAGGDPWQLNEGLQTGRPALIDHLARAFRDAGQSTAASEAAFDEARRRFEASWNRDRGANPVNDSAEVRRVTVSLGLQAAQLSCVSVDLERIAAMLAESQRQAAWYVTALEHDLTDIDAEIGTGCGDVDDLCDDAVAETRAVLLCVRQIRADYSTALHDALSRLRDDGVPPADVEVADTLLVPSADTSAQQVKDWWDALSDGQKRLLVDQHPTELGNLDGIPAEVRGQVNASVLNDDLNRVEDAARGRGLRPEVLRDNASNDIGNDVFANPQRYGLTGDDVTRYRNAVKTNDGLRHDEGIGAVPPRPVMLWAYDPLAFKGKGRAAISIGDPDKARNTTVIVPGTNGGVKWGWLADEQNDAVNLYDQSSKADPVRPAAVLAWIGYDAPEFDGRRWELAIADPARLQQVGTPWIAREGAALLAGDVNGLTVTHDAAVASHTAVVGYSYGATTVADAFAGGRMRADDAVLIGCPGTDLASGASDFHLGGGKLYVGAASTDAISWIGETGSGAPNAVNDLLGRPLGPRVGLGPDPAHEGFGAVRFRAEVAGSRNVVPWFDDHLNYFDVGSEALHNMTEIAVGHGDDLAREGMTAPYRGDARVTTPGQVHTPFGTLPLPHLEIRAPITVDPEWDRPAGSVTNRHGF